MKNDTLLVHFYVDEKSDSKQESSYSLYEDDGKSLEYQKEKFTQTKFSVSSDTDSLGNKYSLSIGKSEGSFDNQLTERVYKLVIHGFAEEKKNITCSELDLVSIKKGIFMNYYSFNKSKNQLEIVLNANNSYSYNLEIK